MSNHTAGHWGVLKSSGNYFVTTENGDVGLAEVSVGVGPSQAAANTILMAAAPDLLEAVELAFDWLAQDPSTVTAVEREARLAGLGAAIALAKEAA